MNKKLLCAALIGGLGVTGSVGAQEFDDRWYITGSTGFNLQDGERDTHNAPFVTLGLGKFISPTWSVDGELNYQNPSSESNQDLNWSQYGISIDFRRHFLAEGRNWNPYVLAGLGYQRSEEEFDPSEFPARFPSDTAPGEREEEYPSAKLGGGLEGDVGRVRIRTELAWRISADDDSIGAYRSDDLPRDDGADWFGDLLATVGVVVPLGPEPAPPAPPPPPPPAEPEAPSCEDLDDDGDGVNNCDDRCPDSQPGQTIGPDGCPVPVSIDLKGVNFDFDRAQLRPDAVSILDEAIEILQRYPELRVEVAGHTDSIGTDEYNQVLSERRASAVYDYLTENDIDGSRLEGPIGYGESRPIAPNTNDDGSDNPEGRARNRRTELNVEN